ncbi:hypothetical protein FB451DRAFT_1170954 [Mycena latifolia]|nr:hypothetical protein FB451DRAFT_1170954 [Mycena latifolia]
MPSKARVSTVIEHWKTAVDLLVTVAEARNTPYLTPMAGTAVLLRDTVVRVRNNKEECLKMTEQVGTIIIALADICSTTEDELPPSILSNIATFLETLQKVLAFVRRQVDKSLIKRVVRHLEDSSLLSECQIALDHAVGLFNPPQSVDQVLQLQCQFHAASSRKDSEISNLLTAHESCSTVRLDVLGHTRTLMRMYAAVNPPFWVHFPLVLSCLSGLTNHRLSDISLLPGSPQIFHGRDTELQHIVAALLQQDPSRIAILGPGGVGKSSLSLAALYNNDVAAKFGSERHFISCESAQSAEDIAAGLVSHFALEGTGNPTKKILQYLSGRDAVCVIVLDNMETPWEFSGGRSAVEDFLSHLSAFVTLHLIITMRGEERPGKVRWTRPFLRPLSPLSDLAARRVFRDITDVADNDAQVEELLRFTDNLPLAITLMASLVAFEGAAPVLDRWKSERISLLSEGADKNSNLSTSITMSLSSPRLTAIPDALTLLSLLAVLPDGVTDSTLTEMDLPLRDIALCRVTLCRTSLAYVDHDRQLKALVPIREHMLAFHPPSPALLPHLEGFFFNLVKLFRKRWARVAGSGLVHRLSADLGNIHSLVHLALEAGGPPSVETISCIIDLAHFTHVTLIGSRDLLQSISDVVDTLVDANLQGNYFVALSRLNTKDTTEALYLKKALHYFQLTENISAQAMAYHDLSMAYINAGGTNKVLKASTCALSLARRLHDHSVFAQVLRQMSCVLHNVGNMRRARAVALEAQAHAQLAGDLDTEFLCILSSVSHFITAGNYGRAAELCIELVSLAKGLGVEMGPQGLNVFLMQNEIHFRKTEYEQARSVNRVIVDITSHNDTRTRFYAAASYNLFLIDIATGASVKHETLQTLRKLLPPGVHYAVFCDIAIADSFRRRGELTRAHELYNQSLTLARGQYAETTNECFQKLGDTAYARSRMDPALEYYVLHLALSRKMEDFENTHQALRRIGDIFIFQGDKETARSLFTLCLDGFTLMDIHKARGECLFHLGDLLKNEGNVINAARCWEQALPLFECVVYDWPRIVQANQIIYKPAMGEPTGSGTGKPRGNKARRWKCAFTGFNRHPTDYCTNFNLPHPLNILERSLYKIGSSYPQ